MEERNRWKVELDLVLGPGDTNLVAIGEAVLDNLYVIKPVKILKNPQKDQKDRPWIFVLPNIRKTRDGVTEWERAFEFVSPKAREEFETAMCNGVRKAVMRPREIADRESDLQISVERMEHKSRKGTATIVYEDMLRIKHVGIMEGKYGTFITYPNTEVPKNKEIQGLLDVLSQTKERLTHILRDDGCKGQVRKETTDLLHYVEEQEAAFSRKQYEPLIHTDSYLFQSYVERAVIREYNSTRSIEPSAQIGPERKSPVPFRR